jgi:hypothetical protein
MWIYHICDEDMLSFCLQILGASHASALLICSLRGLCIVLMLVLLFTLPIFCCIFWVRFSDLLSPNIFRKVLKKFFFLLLLVPTVDNFCVCSMLEDKEMLMHQLSVVRFLSEGEVGEVILSATPSKEHLNTYGFSRLFFHWQQQAHCCCHFDCHYIQIIFLLAQIPPEIFSAAVFLFCMPFYVS